MSKVSAGHIPTWHPYMPRGADSVKSINLGAAKATESNTTQSDVKGALLTESKAISAESSGNGKVVYFPACVTRSMGTGVNDTETRDLKTVMSSLLDKAGFEAVTPEKVDKLCCGMPFASKGFPEAADQSSNQLEAALWEASKQGKYPILCDTSPCTLRMIEQFEKPLKLLETAGFIEEYLLPHLNIAPKAEPIALHITCSARKMGLDGTLRNLTQLCSASVFEPEEEGCCGFAGDKGFSVPELNAASLARLKKQIPEACTTGVSNSRTCEIGLSLHSGRQYRSIAYLVDECASVK
jgi:D-lactate dehydrogenase